MACVMNGSYWPTSVLDMARSTLGYAEMGPGPMRRRAGGSIGGIAVIWINLSWLTRLWRRAGWMR
ncbi:hypothetical protein ACFPRL_10595 [Pseudoclavibacter helvolus]